MKRRILAITLALSMCLSVSACGDTSDGSNKNVSQGTGDSVTVTTDSGNGTLDEKWIHNFYVEPNMNYANHEYFYSYFKEHSENPDSADYISDANYYVGLYCLDDFDFQGAYDAFEKGDSTGSALCSFAMGRWYMEGKSGEWDFAKAEEYFNKSVDAGCVEANYGLGMLSLYGLGTETDTAKALEYFDKALDGSEKGIIVDTYAAMASVYSSDAFGVDRDLSKAIDYYEKICEIAEWTKKYGIELTELRRRAGGSDNIEEVYAFDDIEAAHAFVENVEGGLNYVNFDEPNYAPKLIYESARYSEMPFQFQKHGNHHEAEYETGWNLLKYACDLGYADAYYYMGTIYYNNHFGYMKAVGIESYEPDYETAFSYYEKAANAGSTEGMKELARSYLNGKGVEKNTDKAIEWYEKAASRGDSQAYIFLGNLYRSTGVLGPDIPKAIDYYEKAIAAGNYAGYNFLGYIYASGTEAEVDYPKAIDYLEKGAYFGNTSCMTMLGDMYADGIGVDKDVDKAFEWFEKAGRAGDAEGYQKIGNCYYNGKIVDQDYEQASKWFLRGAYELQDGKSFVNIGLMHQNGYLNGGFHCSQYYEWAGDDGYAQGYYRLAKIYYNGSDGMAQQLDKAFEFYTKAAEMNYADAINMLGVMYVKGQYVPVEPETALGYFLRAANLGNITAMENVGQCYLDGYGTDADCNAALEWLEKAKEAGSSTENLDQLIETARAGTQGN
ncbi:MAG: hypothetical protein K6G57_06600 [Lachnospiraceae bacterium]|nr:hypothetical protein [Lachnospiraceae bacterium]